MNDQEKNEYVGKLLTDDEVTLDGLEGEVLSKTKELYAELEKGRKKLEELQRDTVSVTDFLKVGQGKLEGFVSILLEEEEKRRNS